MPQIRSNGLPIPTSSNGEDYSFLRCICGQSFIGLIDVSPIFLFVLCDSSKSCFLEHEHHVFLFKICIKSGICLLRSIASFSFLSFSSFCCARALGRASIQRCFQFRLLPDRIMINNVQDSCNLHNLS